MYPPRGEEEAGDIWKMKRAMYGQTCIASRPRAHERGFSEKQAMQRLRYVTNYVTALRRTRWLQSMATTSSQKESPRS